MGQNKIYERACQHIPGGVNSPVRAFNGVGGAPLFIECAEKAMIYDTNGRGYIDYVMSWGPCILGHAHSAVIAAVKDAVDNGLSYGAPTEIEIQLAEKIKQHMPSIELIRMVNSGTEATMTAIRLARGFTGRDKIVKFEGCYHGHSDALLVQAGSGALTLGVPTSPGVPTPVVQDTIVLPYNDIEAVKACFHQYGDEIACVILEPVAANMNCVPADKTFLSIIRDLCDRARTLLVMDEVITGFRVGLGGAQTYYDIKPDLTCLGKIIGGGMPVGAFGGRKDVMSCLAPLGPVYQAGTLSGNPIAMAAGLKTIECLEEDPNFYRNLDSVTHTLAQGIKELADGKVSMHINAMTGLLGFFFTKLDGVKTFKDVQSGSLADYQKFFHALLAEGVYLAPSMYEVAFLSSAHTTEIIDRTLQAVDKVFKQW